MFLIMLIGSCDRFCKSYSPSVLVKILRPEKLPGTLPCHCTWQLHASCSLTATHSWSVSPHWAASLKACASFDNSATTQHPIRDQVPDHPCTPSGWSPSCAILPPRIVLSCGSKPDEVRTGCPPSFLQTPQTRTLWLNQQVEWPGFHQAVRFRWFECCAHKSRRREHKGRATVGYKPSGWQSTIVLGTHRGLALQEQSPSCRTQVLATRSWCVTGRVSCTHCLAAGCNRRGRSNRLSFQTVSHTESVH